VNFDFAITMALTVVDYLECWLWTSSFCSSSF